MNILLLSGSHSRHLYFFSEVLKTKHNFKSVIMERETMFPDFPQNLDAKDKKYFKTHFENRYSAEQIAFGINHIHDVFDNSQSIICKPDQLHSDKIINFINSEKYDLCIIFGTDLIKDKLMKILPDITINLHLGISPYYRGSATLFWPFYFLMPQFCGATFHLITNEPDAGDILHHSIPKLSIGDKIHDVAVNVVKSASRDIINILQNKDMDKWKFYSQKKIGKLFFESDFHPSHLRLIYDQYNDKIVDEYLKGNLATKRPKLINALS